MSIEMLWQAGAFLIAAGAVYGGIRGDLMAIHEKLKDHAEAIKGVNARIDGCMSSRRHDD